LKQADWYALCKREQDNGGEVVGVTLAPRSAQELANEILSSPGATTFLNDDSTGKRKHVVAGGRVAQIVNWPARTVIDIEIDPDSETDFATVRYVETCTVAIGA
jgi:hypothetical protein